MHFPAQPHHFAAAATPAAAPGAPRPATTDEAAKTGRVPTTVTPSAATARWSQPPGMSVVASVSHRKAVLAGVRPRRQCRALEDEWGEGGEWGRGRKMTGGGRVGGAKIDSAASPQPRPRPARLRSSHGLALEVNYCLAPSTKAFHLSLRNGSGAPPACTAPASKTGHRSCCKRSSHVQHICQKHRVAAIAIP